MAPMISPVNGSMARLVWVSRLERRPRNCLSVRLFLAQHVGSETNLSVELRLPDGAVAITIADGQVESDTAAP